MNRLSRLPLALRLLIAIIVGAFGALGQAPFDTPLALLVALTVGFWIWRGEHARPGLMGWAFGTGYFALALVWIVEPFQVDAARHGWMAPFALVLLSGGLALFWGAAFWIARRISARAWCLALSWTGAEMLRAYVFTGFPWASPAQVAVDGPMSILLAWGGPHLVTLTLMGLACILSVPISGAKAPLAMRFGQAALFLAGALALSIPHARKPATMSGHVVRLVQPNAEQHLKWRPDMADMFFQRQIELTASVPEDVVKQPDLVVWPETAIPWRLETAGPLLKQIAFAANGATVALGALRFEGADLRNSLAVLSSDGKISEVYDKHHLVPFGEYVPFGNALNIFGLEALAATLGGFSSGPGPVLLDFGLLGKALPLICYEAVFAHGVNAMPERPAFLLQVTNDAWFGTYAGPQQHLAQARMRAIEQGLPLARAANTGISAMIGPTGRIIAHLPLGEAGFIDAQLPVALAPTYYSNNGNWPVLLVIILGLLSGGFRKSFQNRRVIN